LSRAEITKQIQRGNDGSLGAWLVAPTRRKTAPAPPIGASRPGLRIAAVKRNCETILDGQLMLRVLGTGDLQRSFPHSAVHFRRAAACSSSQATTALGSGSFLSFSAAGPAHHTSSVTTPAAVSAGDASLVRATEVRCRVSIYVGQSGSADGNAARPDCHRKNPR